MSNKLHNALNQQLSNFSVLYEKLHHYHWFVQGKQFFVLHEKFQEDYEELTDFIDEIAERLIQFGGKPVSTLKEYLEITTLSEDQKETKSSTSMVQNLLSDYKQLVSEIQEAIDLAGQYEDNVTEDLFIGISTSFQKKVWLYEAFLSE